MTAQVFLIHGLFMHGAMMQYLHRQLSKQGYQVESFSYRSTQYPLQQNAEYLVEFIKQKRHHDGICHFVGHSLGGLLIRLAYELSPEDFNGRIVTLGTPHNGSEVAKRVANDIAFNLLGKAYKAALDGDLPPWQGRVELGSLAGNKCIGIGMALRDLEKPNDGTVTVAETQLPHQSDHIQLPLSHTAMLYSKRVAAQTAHFLKTAHFNHNVGE